MQGSIVICSHIATVKICAVQGIICYWTSCSRYSVTLIVALFYGYKRKALICGESRWMARLLLSVITGEELLLMEYSQSRDAAKKLRRNAGFIGSGNFMSAGCSNRDTLRYEMR